MKQSEHTPGPWMANLDETTHEGGMPVRAIDPKDGMRFRVADVYGLDCDVNHCEISKANARLIAAAPELLAALQMIVQLNPELPMGCIEDAEAAIAKATGA